MSDAEYDAKIEAIASLITSDKISLDEQDSKKLQKYYDFAKTKFKLNHNDSTQLVNEAFLYLKLKNAKDVDLLQEGDKFGAGFS
jgi:hypothetical protein